MEDKAGDEVERLKTKFLSAWHSVKYSWALKMKTSFSRNSPVLLLGKCYHFKADDEDVAVRHDASDEDSVMGNIDAFRKDFTSRLWMTYREAFPPLPGSALTSDCGWGCMLRAGQMMLAQALVLHCLGRDWTWPEALKLQPLDTESRTTTAAKRLVASLEASLPGLYSPTGAGTSQAHQILGSAEEADAHMKEMYHRTLVSWFGDDPTAPLGLHRLVHSGLMMGRQAGDWYGPAVVAHILRKAIEQVTDAGLAGVAAYVSQDCTVYSADVIDCHKIDKSVTAGTSDPPPSLQNPPTTESSRAVVILIPVRLGGEKTNPEYFNLVKNILCLEYCIGIIGGKPKQACYFVGFQDDSLIYMDPHYCQSFVDVSTSDFPLQSYHCPSPKKMPFTRMDPSCTVGFYSRSVQDYERIRQELSTVLQPSAREQYPAFTFVPGHSRDHIAAPEKREWPFIHDPSSTITTTGDFVLL